MRVNEMAVELAVQLSHDALQRRAIRRWEPVHFADKVQFRCESGMYRVNLRRAV
jgi:hypothetical protein